MSSVTLASTDGCIIEGDRAMPGGWLTPLSDPKQAVFMCKSLCEHTCNPTCNIHMSLNTHLHETRSTDGGAGTVFKHIVGM